MGASVQQGPRRSGSTCTTSTQSTPWVQTAARSVSLPTKNQWRTSSKACAPHLLSTACAPHFRSAEDRPDHPCDGRLWIQQVCISNKTHPRPWGKELQRQEEEFKPAVLPPPTTPCHADRKPPHVSVLVDCTGPAVCKLSCLFHFEVL
jgi:hypothetical protein